MERVARQIELQLVDDPHKSPFFKIFKLMPDNIDGQKEIKKKAMQVIIDDVIPAYYKFRDFFVDEYMPETTKSIGVSDYDED